MEEKQTGSDVFALSPFVVVSAVQLAAVEG